MRPSPTVAAHLATIGLSGALAVEAPLPPELPWDGRSQTLVVGPDDPWQTPSEADGLRTTPDYDTTGAWLVRLAHASPRIQLLTFGSTPAGRDLWLVVASQEGHRTAADLHASGKPTLLAHAGIHAGEIDGKDAGLMLLRDLTEGRRLDGLLERANLLFVPILNPDGHERVSPHGRINQRGPERMGWRTNGRNLNLNRDFTKLETPEVGALVDLIRTWEPDLYLDLHVTDGADYQYDVTFGWNGPFAHSPHIARWLDERFAPRVSRDLRSMGHVPGMLVFHVDNRDPESGLYGWTSDPRFSNGYGDLRHLPSVLVENHSLKPYRQRVLGTYVLLESSLRLLPEEAQRLRAATRADRERRPEQVPLAWRVPDTAPPEVEFLGVGFRRELSAVSGDMKPIWTGETVEQRRPYFVAREPAATATRPVAYWIPSSWPEVIDRLERHGIRTERLTRARTLELEMLRFEDPELADAPFEGRVRVTATARAERRTETYPAGSVRVPTDQPLGDLAVLLLEPDSPDSFFQWGYFHEILSRTEYAEAYVLEPLAEQMLADDPELAQAFASALDADPELRSDPRARLHWFYRRTPYYDERHRLYPVGRELPPVDAP